MTIDPQTLKSVTTADVVKSDRLAATLTRSAEGTVFAYGADYLRAPGPAVALTLPVTEVPVRTPVGAVPPFFAGLLPEGRRLTALRDAVKTSLDDEFTLLLAIGSDPIGDVSILAPGASAVAAEPSVAVAKSSRLDFEALRHTVDRRGIAGVQDKASAAMITLPATEAGRDAILKLDPPEYPHLVENEAWFLALAKKAGLRVPRFHLVTDSHDRRGLLVERFDRGPLDPESHQQQRFAVEDAGQVLGIYPADKYRVSSEQVANALIAHCQAKPVARLELLRMFLFAWLTGNGDFHAKNASIVHTEGEWRVAPAYDLPSTLPYGDDTMALPLAGRTSDLSRKAFMQFADTIGLPAAAANRAIDEMLKATAPALALFEEGAEAFTRTRNRDSVRQLARRRAMLQA